MRALQTFIGRIPARVRKPLLAVVAAVIIFLPQIVGLTVILIYAGTAFVYKISSRTTFLAALIPLGVMPLALLLQQKALAQNLGAFSFSLFVVAITSLCSELIREAKTMQNPKAVDKRLRP